MENNPGSITNRIDSLYQLIRVFLILSSTATSIYLLNTLRTSSGFAKICSMSVEEVPVLSAFVFTHYPKLMIFVLVWQVVNIVLLIKFKREQWAYYFLAAGLVTMFFLEKVVTSANFAPIYQMIESMMT